MSLFPAVIALLLLQEPPPPLTGGLEPAFDGTEVLNLPWTTRVVTLSNTTDKDLDVTVGITNPAATRRERIGRGATVRLQLFTPRLAYYDQEADLEVRDGDGRVLLRWKLADMSSGGIRWARSQQDRQVLALTRSRPGNTPSDWTMQTCRETNLPQRAIGLQGLSVILLSDWKIESLIPSQMEALTTWLADGGTLIIYPGGNPAWLTSDAVRQLAPVKLGRSSVQKFQGAEYAQQELLNGTPLKRGAVEYRRGFGRVVVVPYDLDAPPFDRWDGKGQFLASLAPLPPPPTIEPFDPVAPESTGALAAPVNALPPFLLLLAIVFAFIVLVGPANFIALRKLGRPPLLLATIPALSALFVLIVVACGYVLRGTSTVMSEVVVLDARNGDPLARQTRVFTLFSPSSRAYSLDWPGAETGLPVEHDVTIRQKNWRYFSRMMELGLRIEQDRGWVMRDCGFAQWQARLFVGRTSRTLGDGVRVHFGPEGRVVNGTPWRIARGFVVEQGQLRFFGDVAPGAERALEPTDPSRLSLALSAVERRVLDLWLQNAASRRLMGRVAICVLEMPVDPVRIDARISDSSERTCLLQIIEDSP